MSDEKKPNIVAVISVQGTFVGEEVLDSEDGTVVGLNMGIQMINLTDKTPAGPQVVSVGLKLGKITELPSDAVIAKLDSSSPYYAEFTGKWFDIKTAADLNQVQALIDKIAPFSGKKRMDS